MTSSETPPGPKNPYVGPRAFTRDETLYGRNREIRRLLNLIIAERIVLLYSPSGAGKTSLIQSALVPSLQLEGFHVLPIMRVNMVAQPSTPAPQQQQQTGSSGAQQQQQQQIPPHNRYLLSLLFSLEEALPPTQQKALDILAQMSLNDYLDAYPAPPLISNPRLAGHRNDESMGDSEEEIDTLDELSYRQVLIFDQFEEILTLNPTDHDTRVAFFDQVGRALHNPSRWALFVMREDYTAALDPYVRAIPTRFSTTFRLDLLDESSARLAIHEPASEAGVEFSAEAVSKLTDDLRRVRVQGPGGELVIQQGHFIEPVQLQVVCYSLWEKLPPDTKRIEVSDLERVGDVDNALANYYDECVASIAAQTSTSERIVRDWFDNHLITSQGIRGQVIQGTQESEGLANEVIGRLINAHLARAEKRRGVIWFELAHDRLIAPIQSSNAEWRETHLHMLQRQAAAWASQNRSDGLLLRNKVLQEAQQWARANPGELTSIEREFLQESAQANQREKREKRKNQIISILAAIATLLYIVAIFSFSRAQSAQQQAERAFYTAEAAGLTAEAAGNQASTAKAKAEASGYDLLTARAEIVTVQASEGDAYATASAAAYRVTVARNSSTATVAARTAVAAEAGVNVVQKTKTAVLVSQEERVPAWQTELAYPTPPPPPIRLPSSNERYPPPDEATSQPLTRTSTTTPQPAPTPTRRPVQPTRRPMTQPTATRVPEEPEAYPPY
jgi:hypothetical protein